jgi:ribosomal protein L21E
MSDFKIAAGDQVKTYDPSLGVGTVEYVNSSGDVCNVKFWDGRILSFLTPGLTKVPLVTFNVDDLVTLPSFPTLGIGRILSVRPSSGGSLYHVDFRNRKMEFLAEGLKLADTRFKVGDTVRVLDIGENATAQAVPSRFRGRIGTVLNARSIDGHKDELYTVEFKVGSGKDSTLVGGFFPKELAAAYSAPYKPLTVHETVTSERFVTVGDQVVIPLKDGEVLLLNLKEQTTSVLDADLVTAIRNAHVS